jgi:hypothetical protein
LERRKKGGKRTLKNVTLINIKRLTDHVNNLEKDLEALSEHIAICKRIQQEYE